jgi:hypothetical protein
MTSKSIWNHQPPSAAPRRYRRLEEYIRDPKISIARLSTG